MGSNVQQSTIHLKLFKVVVLHFSHLVFFHHWLSFQPIPQCPSSAVKQLPHIFKLFTELCTISCPHTHQALPEGALSTLATSIATCMDPLKTLGSQLIPWHQFHFHLSHPHFCTNPEPWSTHLKTLPSTVWPQFPFLSIFWPFTTWQLLSELGQASVPLSLFPRVYQPPLGLSFCQSRLKSMIHHKWIRLKSTAPFSFHCTYLKSSNYGILHSFVSTPKNC